MNKKPSERERKKKNEKKLEPKSANGKRSAQGILNALLFSSPSRCTLVPDFWYHLWMAMAWAKSLPLPKADERLIKISRSPKVFREAERPFYHLQKLRVKRWQSFIFFSRAIKAPRTLRLTLRFIHFLLLLFFVLNFLRLRLTNFLNDACSIIRDRFEIFSTVLKI